MKILFACAALLILGSPLAEAQEYDVVLRRASTVGERMQLGIKVSKEDDQAWNVDHQPLAEGTKKTRVQLELDATSKCTAVDKEGYATELRLGVISCHFSVGDQTVPLFIGKDYIVITERPRKVTVNGKPPEPQQSEMIAEIFPPLSNEPTSDDVFFAPGHKVKVGDTWPVNADAIVADMHKKGQEITKDNVSGNMKLESANPKDGVPCLQMRGEMQVHANRGALPGAPAGIECKKLEMQFKVSSNLPVDKHLPRPEESTEMRVESEGGGVMKGNGIEKEVSFHILTHIKREYTQRPMP